MINAKIFRSPWNNRLKYKEKIDSIFRASFWNEQNPFKIHAMTHKSQA